jgi:hypothetical protein
MSIYLILENQVHDEEAYERYKTAVKPWTDPAWRLMGRQRACKRGVFI